ARAAGRAARDGRIPEGCEGTRGAARSPGGGEGGPGGAEEGARGPQTRAGSGGPGPRAREEVVAQARTWRTHARTAGRKLRRPETSACHRRAPGHDEGAQDLSYAPSSMAAQQPPRVTWRRPSSGPSRRTP